MSWSEWLNRHPAAGIGVMTVVLIVVTVIAVRNLGGGSLSVGEQRYFYDLSSGDLMVMDNRLAPVTTPSGSQAVWAHVFSCGSCEDTSQRFIAYLEKAGDALKQEMDSKPESQRNLDLVTTGLLVAEPLGEAGVAPDWVPQTSPAGMRISETHRDRCPGGAVRYCHP